MCYQLYVLDDRQGNAMVAQLPESHVAGTKVSTWIEMLLNTTYACVGTICVYVVGGIMGSLISCSTAS